jgi:hypothetical protein
LDWVHPFLLGAKAASEDAPSFRDILGMEAQTKDNWFDAMEAEITALIEKETFKVIDITQVPQGEDVIKSTWVFKRK